MAPWLILVVAAAYLCTGVDVYLKTNQIGWLMVWISYAVANIGFYLITPK